VSDIFPKGDKTRTNISKFGLTWTGGFIKRIKFDVHHLMATAHMTFVHLTSFNPCLNICGQESNYF